MIMQSRGVPLSGSAVSVDPNYLNAIAMKRFQKWKESIHLLMEHKAPQLELMLLRACAGAPKSMYLIRSLPPHLLQTSLLDMESLLLTTLRQILVEQESLFGSFQLLSLLYLFVTAASVFITPGTSISSHMLLRFTSLRIYKTKSTNFLPIRLSLPITAWPYGPS